MASFLETMLFLLVNVQELVLQFTFNALRTGFLKELKLVKINKKYKLMIHLDFHVKFANKNTQNLYK